MADIFSDHVNISTKKVNISEFSKVPQSIDVRIASPYTAPADRPFLCYQSEDPICSNRQGLGSSSLGFTA